MLSCVFLFTYIVCVCTPVCVRVCACARVCVCVTGGVPWWQILLIFCVSGLVGFVGLLALLYSGPCCYRTAKDALFPAVTLPPHFQAVRNTLRPPPSVLLFLCPCEVFSTRPFSPSTRRVSNLCELGEHR